MRQLKREVKIGNVTIGGSNPIAVQTMLNVPVEDLSLIHICVCLFTMWRIYCKIEYSKNAGSVRRKIK